MTNYINWNKALASYCFYLLVAFILLYTLVTLHFYRTYHTLNENKASRMGRAIIWPYYYTRALVY